MKRIFYIILISIITTTVHAQPDGWEVNSAEFEYSMTITAVVELNGEALGDTNDYLAAFAGTECRGVVQANYEEAYDSWLFFLTIFSNEYSGEEITFKYYKASEDSIIDAFYPMEFNESANYGAASSPFLISDEAPLTPETELSANNIVMYVNQNDEQLSGGVQITNTGGGILDYTTSLKLNTWASITSSPVSLGPEQTAMINVEADPAGMPNGIYRDTLIVNATEQFKLPIVLDVGGTSIAELRENQVNIFPNPATDYITIKAHQPVQHVKIYNALGVIVKQLDVNRQKDVSIQTSILNQGVYMVSIAGDHYQKVVKINIR